MHEFGPCIAYIQKKNRSFSLPYEPLESPQAPSWSGIDHGGHWKLLMYGIRRFFSPVLVSGTYNATQADALSVYITNDQPYTVKGARSEIHAKRVTSCKVHPPLPCSPGMKVCHLCLSLCAEGKRRGSKEVGICS